MINFVKPWVIAVMIILCIVMHHQVMVQIQMIIIQLVKDRVIGKRLQAVGVIFFVKIMMIAALITKYVKILACGILQDEN